MWGAVSVSEQDKFEVMITNGLTGCGWLQRFLTPDLLNVLFLVNELANRKVDPGG